MSVIGSLEDCQCLYELFSLMLKTSNNLDDFFFLDPRICPLRGGGKIPLLNDFTIAGVLHRPEALTVS